MLTENHKVADMLRAEGGNTVRPLVYAAPQASATPSRCEYCDGTGDVHSQDGEWRGVCICSAGQKLKDKPVGDGWQPIKTAPQGVRVLLGPQHSPVIGIVKHYEDPDSDDPAIVCSVVHYNDTVLVSDYRTSEWAPLQSEDAKRWRWLWNHAENVRFSYQVDPMTRLTVSGLHCGSLKEVVDNARAFMSKRKS